MMNDTKVYLPHMDNNLWIMLPKEAQSKKTQFKRGEQTLLLSDKTLDKNPPYVADQANRLYLESVYKRNFERNLLPTGREVGQANV